MFVATFAAITCVCLSHVTVSLSSQDDTYICMLYLKPFYRIFKHRNWEKIFVVMFAAATCVCLYHHVTESLSSSCVKQIDTFCTDNHQRISSVKKYLFQWLQLEHVSISLITWVFLYHHEMIQINTCCIYNHCNGQSSFSTAKRYLL